MPDTPLHVHDCDSCVFLGHFVTEEGTADLYVCMNTKGTITTCIARYSDEGSDYRSNSQHKDDKTPFWASAPDMVECGMRAIKAGYNIRF